MSNSTAAAYRELYDFVETVSLITLNGEDFDGDKYDMTLVDCMETLETLVHAARRALDVVPSEV